MSQLFHAKNNKETIASWKSNLNKILHVFNVRSIVSVWLLLTVRPQTELAINTHNMVSEMHRNMVKSQEGADDQHQLVSVIHTPLRHQMNNSHHCLDSS